MRTLFIFLILLTVNSVFAQLDAGQDTTICNGEEIQLNASGGSNYHWTSIPPDPTLNEPDIPNPTVQPQTTTMYIVESREVGTNMLLNGSFELGNVDFTSEYTYNPSSIWDPGTYAIVNDAGDVHQNFFCDSDHTTGNGLMMCVNGAEVPNVVVWSTTLTNVDPNTEYEFSTWISSLSPISPAKLQFKVNGVLLGNPFNASWVPCQWNQFFEIWESNDANSATLSIVNQNTAENGNDFSLDDISFSNVFYLTDTVMVYVVDLPTSTFNAEEEVCTSISTFIEYTGSGVDTAIYHWDFEDGNVISGSGQGPYEVQWDIPGEKEITLWVEHACKSDTTAHTIMVNQSPTAKITADATSIPYGTFTTLHGELNGNPGPLQFNWQPQNLLINPDTIDPQTVNLENTTEYILTITDESSLCQTTDTILIEVTGGALNILSLTALPDTICEGDSTLLILEVIGGSGNYTANWSSEPIGFDHSGPEMELKVGPHNSITYKVWIFDGFNSTPESQVELVVQPLTTITTEPVDQQTSPNQPVFFEVSAVHTMDYQWQISEDNGSSWVNTIDDGNITGSTTSILSIDEAIESMNGWLFRCLLSGNCNTIISQEAILNVINAPTILNSLEDAETCELEEIQISYQVGNFYDIINFTLVLSYDDQILEFTELLEISPELEQNIDVSDLNGIINIQWISDIPLTLSDGLAFKIGFFGKVAGNTQLDWDKPSCEMTNKNGYSPDLSFTESEIIINPLAVAPGIVYADPDSLSVLETEDIKLWEEGGSGDQLLWLASDCDGDTIGEGSPLFIEMPEQTTTYFARWVNGCGLSACASVTVVISGEFDIYAPNAFSPNGDGINDKFTLVSPADLPVFQLYIFNRWGQLVFESNDVFLGWDGYHKGKPSPLGTYVWKAVYRLQREGPGSEEQMQTGSLVITR